VVEPYDMRLRARRGERLYEALRRAGVPIRAECGGRGVCGKCRVVLGEGVGSPLTEAERRHLTLGELEKGYRLACQLSLAGDSRIYIPPESRPGALKMAVRGLSREARLSPLVEKVRLELNPPSLENPRPDSEELLRALAGKLGASPSSLGVSLAAARGMARVLREHSWRAAAVVWRRRLLVGVEPPDSQGCFGAAVDLGTTKIVVQLVDMRTGEAVAAVAAENPQVLYGDDIATRLAAARDPATLEEMRVAAVSAVNNLVKAAALDHGVGLGEVYAAVVVGNTVMHHLFLGLDVRGLGSSPYVPAVAGPLELEPREAGLEFARRLYLPPVVAGYVGSDALADVVATGMHLDGSPSLLIDIGTNTEVVLNTGGGLLACSAPSGPAFEGGHVRFGMKAAAGAIERIWLEGGEVRYSVVGGGEPLGICGSALVDLAAALRRAGLLDAVGRLSRRDPRVRRGPAGEGYEFVVVPAGGRRGVDIAVSEREFGELRLARAAVYSGAAVLLERAGLAPGDLERVYLAGSFGYGLDPVNAVEIGLLPPVEPRRVVAVGNTAVEGARMMLVSEEAVKEAEELAGEIRYVELTAAPEFKRVFREALRFPAPP